jgi:hypothetical protein
MIALTDAEMDAIMELAQPILSAVEAGFKPGSTDARLLAHGDLPLELGRRSRRDAQQFWRVSQRVGTARKRAFAHPTGATVRLPQKSGLSALGTSESLLL